MTENYFNNHLKKMVNKGYDDAKFYLDILIENGIINKSDEKVKQLFINWFKKNKEFDLQIENGDFAIEDGDFKFVPDFEKIDIIKFINWYNNEKDDFIKYLNENGILTIKQDSILRQNIKTENIVINNGKIKSLNQNSQNESKRIRWDIIGFLGFIIALLTFLFGDNIFSRLNINNNVTKNSKNIELLEITDTIQVPYLNSKPVLDKGLYLQQNYTELVFGGANIDSVKISSRKKTGEKIEIKKNNSNNLILDIFEKPYIEFSYKKRFYSLEIVSENSGNSFICIIKNINEPTLNLLEVR